MTLPFTYAPVFQTEREVGLSASLHQIAEVMAVAGITEEDVVGIAHLRTIGLHEVISLRLLFTRLNLVNSARLKCLTFPLLLGQIVKITLIAVLRKCEPVHHITSIVNLEERLYLAADGILHLSMESEMQRLAGNRLQLVGNIL